MLPDGEHLIRVISTEELSILGMWCSFGGPVTFKILLDVRPCDPPTGGCIWSFWTFTSSSVQTCCYLHTWLILSFQVCTCTTTYLIFAHKDQNSGCNIFSLAMPLHGIKEAWAEGRYVNIYDFLNIFFICGLFLAFFCFSLLQHIYFAPARAQVVLNR